MRSISAGVGGVEAAKAGRVGPADVVTARGVAATDEKKSRRDGADAWTAVEEGRTVVVGRFDLVAVNAAAQDAVAARRRNRLELTMVTKLGGTGRSSYQER
mmetsp:Transcript_22059/g.47338  ORF Transcript_22059/g.47338 Transcript_22059/m.47338 type:complete len:101 (+) Transcript_22059:757-1059(+)